MQKAKKKFDKIDEQEECSAKGENLVNALRKSRHLRSRVA
ncbi:hypothetical protein Javan68_0026 [Streptococcus phage Javan68]|nr:hypothetical protein Javan68_0026 [Streptococcus phage Javan68]